VKVNAELIAEIPINLAICTDLNSVCYNSAQSMDRCSALR
jgi:hypothetical protein